MTSPDAPVEVSGVTVVTAFDTPMPHFPMLLLPRASAAGANAEHRHDPGSAQRCIPGGSEGWGARYLLQLRELAPHKPTETTRRDRESSAAVSSA